jgi:hypothetical protein
METFNQIQFSIAALLWSTYLVLRIRECMEDGERVCPKERDRQGRYANGRSTRKELALHSFCSEPVYPVSKVPFVKTNTVSEQAERAPIMSKICGTVDETLRRWRQPIAHTFICHVCAERHTEHFLPQSTSVRKTIRKVQWLLSILRRVTVYRDIVSWQPEPICQDCVGKLPL